MVLHPSVLQMLSPMDEQELAAAWRRTARPDGKVAAAELEHLLSSLQHGLQEHELEAVVGQLLELEADEGLEYADFLQVMRSADSSNSSKVLQAFQVFDREGLGLIDTKELREVCYVLCKINS